MRPVCLSLAARLFAIAACAVSVASETTSPESGGRPIPSELAGLRARWVEAMPEFHVPGFAVVVVRDDKVIYLDTFGFRDLEAKLPVTPDTSFYIASCTKPFTAMGVMKLVDEGKVSLDAPAKKYLPRFTLPDPAAADKVTVTDLLAHRLGISCGPVVFLDAYTGEITDDRYFALLAKHGEIEGAPRYTNVHFTLAGRVIESASGMPWRDYLARHIFSPAGMTTATGYADEMYARKDVAIPYELTSNGLRRCDVRKTDGTMHAAGGLGMSITDLGRWLRLNLNRGQIDGRRIISESSATAMQTIHAPSSDGQIRILKGFGFGWMIGTFRPDGPTYLMHTGGYAGASAHVSFLPEKRIGVAVVTNVDAPGSMFAEAAVSIDILDRLLGGEHEDYLAGLRAMVKKRLPGMLEQAAKESATVRLDEPGRLTMPLDAYIGEYTDDQLGTIRVSKAADGLRMKIGALPLQITGCEQDAFTVRVSGDARQGRFELAGGKATAVVLELPVGATTFRRR